MARQPNANPPVTFTHEQLKAVIAQAIAEHEIAKAQKAKADNSDKYTALTISAFKRRGFTDIRPREIVKTYNLWIAEGRKVKEAEKSVPVKGLRLFHISQTEPISEKEKAEFLAKRAAKTSDKLPPVTPLPETPKTKAKKAKPVPTSERPSPSPRPDPSHYLNLRGSNAS